MSNISGIVLDELGNPLNGANVYYLDIETGEYDADLPATSTGPLGMIFPGGSFSLPFIPNGQIKISHIGFDPAYRNIPAVNPNAPLDLFFNIDLEPASYDLDPVIIYPEEEKKKSILPLLLVVLALSQS